MPRATCCTSRRNGACAVGQETRVSPMPAADGMLAMRTMPAPMLAVEGETVTSCQERYGWRGRGRGRANDRRRGPFPERGRGLLRARPQRHAENGGAPVAGKMAHARVGDRHRGGGHRHRRIARGQARGGDDEPQDHVAQPWSGFHGQPDDGHSGHRGQRVRSARVHDPRFGGRAVRHRRDDGAGERSGRSWASCCHGSSRCPARR